MARWIVTTSIVLSLLLLLGCTKSQLTTEKQPLSTNDNAVQTDAQTTDSSNSTLSPIVIDNTTEDTNFEGITSLLQHLKYEVIDMNSAHFHTTTESNVYKVNAVNPKQNYILYEQAVYQGELMRYAQQANYTVKMYSDEKNESNESIHNFSSEINYQVNNEVVYFTDEYGNLNYFTFAKEDAYLETIGQLERIVALFNQHEQAIKVHSLEDKLYVNLTLPEDTFITNYTLVTETVFNGFFDTKTKEELQDEEAYRQELNWPNQLYSNTVTLVLDKDKNIESYAVVFESDAYNRDEQYRYSFSLMTSLFDVNKSLDTSTP